MNYALYYAINNNERKEKSNHDWWQMVSREYCQIAELSNSKFSSFWLIFYFSFIQNQNWIMNWFSHLFSWHLCVSLQDFHFVILFVYVMFFVGNWGIQIGNWMMMVLIRKKLLCPLFCFSDDDYWDQQHDVPGKGWKWHFRFPVVFFVFVVVEIESIFSFPNCVCNCNSFLFANKLNQKETATMSRFSHKCTVIHFPIKQDETVI